jgi:hypothetical protein
MDLNARNVAFVLGIVFLIAGVLGYINNPIVGPNGLFMTNTAHNMVHILSGVFLLLGIYTALTPSLALKILGVVYAIVAIAGFVMMKGMSGIMLGVQMNAADHWLHIGLAVILLLAGFGLPAARRAAFT